MSEREKVGIHHCRIYAVGVASSFKISGVVVIRLVSESSDYSLRRSDWCNLSESSNWSNITSDCWNWSRWPGGFLSLSAPFSKI